MASIIETFEAKHPGSQRLAARARQVFPSGITHDTRAFAPFPIYVERAQGSRKWDIDGNEYVDYIGGHGALLLGHNRPEVMEAIRGALARGTHFGSSHDLEIAWGEQVVRMVPCAERVRFTSSGTEATMMALRLARAYTGREKVVKLADHFHGWHDAVVPRTDGEGGGIYSPGVPRGVYDALTIVPQDDIAALEEALAGEDVAAVIFETSGAHWGANPIAPGYHEAARRLTRATGTLLIFDEVITGFRMAPGGAQEYYGVTPDLSAHAKIVAGGLPGGCVAGSADILNMMEIREDDPDWNASGRVFHPGTFNANPESAAAGATALRIIAEGGQCERAAEAAARLVHGINTLFAERAVPGSAWATSSMWHLNLGYEAPRPAAVEWEATERPRGIEPGLARTLRQALLNHGVDLMGTGGMVSSAHTDDDIDATIEAFRSAIDDLRTEGALA